MLVLRPPLISLASTRRPRARAPGPPLAAQIVASSNYCHVYEFSPEGKWVTKNIEGPLFLVRTAAAGGASAAAAAAAAAAPAQHRMWVLNRVGRSNLVQDVKASLELSVDQGFYFFSDARRAEQPRHALWFPDEERAAGEGVVKALNRLVKLERELERKGSGPGAGAGGNGGGGAAAEEAAAGPAVTLGAPRC